MQSKHDFRFPAARLDGLKAWLTKQDYEWKPGAVDHVVIRVYTENGWREMYDNGTGEYVVSAYLVPIVRHYLRGVRQHV